MKFDPINEYYRNNPPKNVMDDLGIFHECEVPLPAKYARSPCSCGIIHKWEKPETFILEEFEALPGKMIKKCISCKELLMLELWNG